MSAYGFPDDKSVVLDRAVLIAVCFVNTSQKEEVLFRIKLTLA
jgi:hypothetical protein